MTTGNKNWLGDIQCFEHGPERPESEEAIAAILTDHQLYPSPVRPLGSRHSMTPCMAVLKAGRWGTAIDMTAFTGQVKIHDVDQNRGTAKATFPAGVTLYDAAHQLREKGYQFRVNTELGTLTMGAAACGATKDSSFPGEPGQVCHDVVGMRLVRPDGDIRDYKEGEPDFDALRCSYGLFGVATKVTFQVFRHEPISIRHEKLPPQQFRELSTRWLEEGNALFLYLFPYAKEPHIMAELRHKGAAENGNERSLRMEARNYFWKAGLHKAAHGAQRLPASLAEKVGDMEQVLVRNFLNLTDVSSIDPVGQIVNFATGAEKFTFSMWAFEAQKFPAILAEYIKFCRKFEEDNGFRTILPHVSYHIRKDESSLLSYSRKWDVWTLDPIASGDEPGWIPFLNEFNKRCVDWGGQPLFNQSPLLKREHVVRAFDDGRLVQFEEARRRFDPENRMLNDYFAKLLVG